MILGHFLFNQRAYKPKMDKKRFGGIELKRFYLIRKTSDGSTSQKTLVDTALTFSITVVST